MTLCLQIIKNELQSWKGRNITPCAASSLSLALIRCPLHTVLCMEMYGLQMGFSTFSNPGMAKPFWWQSKDHFVRCCHMVLFMTHAN